MILSTRRETLLSAAALAGLAACQPKAAKEAPAAGEKGAAAMESLLKDHVARGSAPGLVALVEHAGQTRIIPAGKLSLEPGAKPVEANAIYRIASMTKPVTAAVTMMLVEDGKLRLDEPIDRLAPELANRRVLKRVDGPVDDTVPAKRPITIEDVLTFRHGWGIVLAQGYPIQKAIGDLPGFGMPKVDYPITPDAWMARLGQLPLMAQPGEQWLYTNGSDLLGVLIARAAGKPFPDFLQERIFGPLAMNDTAFWTPAEKLDRFATAYWPQSGKQTLFDRPDGMYAKPPTFPAGDAGLVSTAGDFDAFTRFLKTGLAPDGRRLLSEASLTGMKTNHLTQAQADGGRMILGPGRGWGYGMSVVTGANPEGLSPGAYGWEGGFGTSWFTDPTKDLTAILLTQRAFDSPDPPQLHKDFWKAAYVAAA